MGDCRVNDIPQPFPLVRNLFQLGLNHRVVPVTLCFQSNDIPSILSPGSLIGLTVASP